MLPSGSLELLPSSETLSIGKVIAWSGPATAIGGLFFSAQPSHEVSFLQERQNNIPINKKEKENFKVDLINLFSKPKLPYLVDVCRRAYGPTTNVNIVS